LTTDCRSIDRLTACVRYLPDNGSLLAYHVSAERQQRHGKEP